MKIRIERITEGEESIHIRYREPNPTVNRIIGIINNNENKLWGRSEEESVCVDIGDVLYLESVDDRLFAYTKERVLRIEGSLNSFIREVSDEAFFRCSKSMIINVNRVISLKSLSSNRIDAILEGGEHIIISRRYASEFRRLLREER